MPEYRTLVETDIGFSRMIFPLEMKFFLAPAARGGALAQSALINQGGLPQIMTNDRPA